MIIYLVASYYLPHNIIYAGKWCDALRMVIKEGHRYAGFDVNVEIFDLDGDDVDEDEDVEDFPSGSFNRHMDEMIASFTEGTPKHHHPQTSGSYTPQFLPYYQPHNTGRLSNSNSHHQLLMEIHPHQGATAQFPPYHRPHNTGISSNANSPN